MLCRFLKVFTRFLAFSQCVDQFSLSAFDFLSTFSVSFALFLNIVLYFCGILIRFCPTFVKFLSYKTIFGQINTINYVPLKYQIDHCFCYY